MAWRILECLDYEKSLREPKPVVNVKLSNLAGEEFGYVKLQVDTGFEGSILLPSDIYEFFKIAELPQSMWRLYTTLTGTITMRTARAIAEVAGLRFEVIIESPLYGGWASLVGREFLSKLKMLLDGPRRRLCLVDK